MMEMKPGASAINMPGETPKKSKLEGALQFMNLAASAASLGKDIASMKTGAGGAGFGAGWKPSTYKNPLEGMTKRILGS